jgi:hypothetical protein
VWYLPRIPQEAGEVEQRANGPQVGAAPRPDGSQVEQSLQARPVVVASQRSPEGALVAGGRRASIQTRKHVERHSRLEIVDEIPERGAEDENKPSLLGLVDQSLPVDRIRMPDDCHGIGCPPSACVALGDETVNDGVQEQVAGTERARGDAEYVNRLGGAPEVIRGRPSTPQSGRHACLIEAVSDREVYAATNDGRVLVWNGAK